MMIKSIHCQFVLLTEYHSLNLTCDIFLNNHPTNIIVNWYKDQQLIIDSQTKNYNQSKFHLDYNQKNSQYILTILKANAEDVGNYECRQISIDNHTTQILHLHRFAVRAKPRIRSEFGRNIISQKIWANDEWTIKCSFLSKYHQLNSTLEIVRFENNNNNNDYIRDHISHINPDMQMKNFTKNWLEQNSHRIRIRMYNDISEQFNNQSVIEMTITKVDFKDRGYIACYGINPIANDHLLIFLRVKDRIQILWPIIVIVTFSLYLFAIITIYEYRRISPFNLLQLDWDST